MNISVISGLRKTLLISCLFSLIPGSFSQVDTLALVNQLCQQYLEEEKQVLADTLYLPDPEHEVFTAYMADFVRKRFLYYSLLSKPVEIKPERTATPLVTDSLKGCRLQDAGAPDVFLEVTVTEKGLRIAGTQGEIIGKTDIQYLDSLIAAARGIVVKRRSIYDATRNFIRAKNAFSLKGEIDSLALICAPAYLEILQIGHEADLLAGVPMRNWVISELYTDWMGSDTAVSQIDIANYGKAILYLKKVNGDWQVFGEKGVIGNAENVALTRQELDQIKAKAGLRNAIQEELNPALISFLQHGREDSLKERSTPDFFMLMEKVRWKFGAYKPEYLKVEGMMFPINMDTKVYIKGDSAAILCYEDTVYLLREKGQWLYAGFNQFWGKAPTDEFVETAFDRLLFDFQVSYDAFNGELAEVYLPEPGEQDTMLYHYMTELTGNAQFSASSETLWAYMQSHMRTKKRHFKKEVTFVYLSFIVEKDGSLSDLKVLESPGKRKARKAQKMVENMPPWVPAEQYEQAVKMYRVLIVPVY